MLRLEFRRRSFGGDWKCETQEWCTRKCRGGKSETKI